MSQLPPETGTIKIRILLAEDNVINQKIAEALLSRHGYQVTVVENGKEAIEALGKESFDAILMDLQMPEMDGLEAARAIRDLPSPLARVPIIAMTAGTNDADKDQCRDAGMDGHLTKPLDVAKLAAMLAPILARRDVPPGSGEPR